MFQPLVRGLALLLFFHPPEADAVALAQQALSVLFPPLLYFLLFEFEFLQEWAEE